MFREKETKALNFHNGILFLLSILTGFYLVWVILEQITFQLTLSDIFTLVFTATLVYYASIENRIHELQYKLSVQTSQPIVQVKRDERDNSRLITLNLGELPAYDVTCRIIGWPENIDSIEFFSTAELHPNRPESVFIPKNYQEIKHLAVTVTYFTDVDMRDFKTWGGLL